VNVARLLHRSGRVHRARPAIALGAMCLHDYHALASRAARIAHALHRCGVGPGDRVALWMDNVPEYVELLWGALWAGAAVVPINARLHVREADYCLAHSRASMCFVDEPHALQPAAAEAARVRLVVVPSPELRGMNAASPLAEPIPRAPDDLAWLFYTSGTTGRPKGVMISHRNLLAMTLCYFADVDPIAAGEAILHAAPLSHGSGLYGFPHVAAGALQIIPDSAGFDPVEVAALAETHRGIAMFCAPTMVKRLVDHVRATRATLPGLKTIVYGGGPMYLEDIREAMALMGDRFVQIYGQGESPMTITALSRDLHADREHPRHLARLASVGVAQSCVEVRVAGGDDRPLPVAEPGEVLVRGDSVMRGYWDDPDASARTLANGWLHTGDIGRLDEDGFLTLLDRSKDLIISGGSNIYPREVEEVLLEHPGVAEVAVVGRPHREWGEEVVAFVVRASGATLSAGALDALCLERIARFKRPRDYRFVSALPKNHYGKVLKTELRDRLREREASSEDD
jgi:long-chain acyl-CoA synthetase